MRRTPISRWRTCRWLGPGLIAATLLVMRLPSLFEPTWYADEGTYADIGYAISHGAHLYVQAWDNKPPGVYWLAALVATHGSPSFWLAVTAWVLATVVSFCVLAVSTRLAGRNWGIAAGVLAAVLMSAPNLDGDLFNAEPAGAAAAAVGMTLVVFRFRRQAPALFAAGAMFGVALLFKAVFVTDALAAVFVFLVLHRELRWQRRLIDLACLAAGGALVLALAAIALASTGSLGPALHVLTTNDTGYVAFANSGTSNASHFWLAALTVTRVVVPLVITAAVAWFGNRRHPEFTAALVWLGLDLTVVMLSARGFTHYVQQAEAPICLLVAVIGNHFWRRSATKILSVLAVVVAGPFCFFVLWVPRAQLAWVNGGNAPYFEAGNFVLRQIPGYYLNGYDSLIHGGTTAAFARMMPADLAKQQAATQWFASHSRSGETVFVWGSIHWAYVLAGRQPAGRYVTLNSAYYLDPDSQDLLETDLARHFPVVMIADAPLPYEILARLRGERYVLHRGAVSGDDVWVGPGEP